MVHRLLYIVQSPPRSVAGAFTNKKRNPLVRPVSFKTPNPWKPILNFGDSGCANVFNFCIADFDSHMGCARQGFSVVSS